MLQGGLGEGVREVEGVSKRPKKIEYKYINWNTELLVDCNLLIVR